MASASDTWWDRWLGTRTATQQLAVSFLLLGASATAGTILFSLGGWWTIPGSLISYTGLWGWWRGLRKVFTDSYGRDRVALAAWIGVSVGLLTGLAIAPFSEGDTAGALFGGAAMGGISYLVAWKTATDEERRRSTLPPPPIR